MILFYYFLCITNENLKKEYDTKQVKVHRMKIFVNMIDKVRNVQIMNYTYSIDLVSSLIMRTTSTSL